MRAVVVVERRKKEKCTRLLPQLGKRRGELREETSFNSHCPEIVEEVVKSETVQLLASCECECDGATHFPKAGRQCSGDFAGIEISAGKALTIASKKLYFHTSHFIGIIAPDQEQTMGVNYCGLAPAIDFAMSSNNTKCERVQRIRFTRCSSPGIIPLGSVLLFVYGLWLSQ